jgi:hypothetical protein
MAYAITYNDGTPILIVADGTVNITDTSLAFVGRNFKGYGTYQNQNLVTLLTNSASPNHNRPKNPLQGQLWYDATNRKLNVYDPTYLPNNGWQHAGAATISDDVPGGVAVGDFWYDTSRKKMNVYTPDNFLTIPAYPRLSPSGWVLPDNNLPILDNTTPTPVPQSVVLLENNGKVVGALSNSFFIASSNDSTTTFSLANTAAYSVVNGLNIIGYIQATGGVILNNAPASSTSAGVTGQIAVDANYIYVCTSTNTWKRTSNLTTF